MADFITAVKSAGDAESGKNGDAFLTAVETKDIRATQQQRRPSSRSDSVDDRNETHEHRLQAQQSHARSGHDAELSKSASSPAEALRLLRSQPTLDVLLQTLERLNTGSFRQPFALAAPGPMQAQMINALLNDIVPTFWPTLRSGGHGELLLSTLRNVTGLNAIAATLRLLTAEVASGERLLDLLDIAHKVLAGDNLIRTIYDGVCETVSDHMRRIMTWREVVNLIGSGKFIGTVAQAQDAVRVASKSSKMQSVWLSSGSDYCAWLGRNIAKMAPSQRTEKTHSPAQEASQLLAKGLSLGHPPQLLKGLLLPLDRSKALDGEPLRSVIQALPIHAKRSFSENLTRWLSSLTTQDSTVNETTVKQSVSSMAGLLSTLFKGDEQILEAKLTDPVLSASISLQVRRACVAVLYADAEKATLQRLLEKLIPTFSSTIFIAHAAISQQESVAQSILIVAGYVHRAAPMSVLMTARSSGHMQGVSNRLESSNLRARWLGMVVGSCLSKMVDRPGSQMEFGTDEMKSDEATRYFALCEVEDEVGTFESFQDSLQSQDQLQTMLRPSTARSASKRTAMINDKPVFGPPRPLPPVQSKIVGDRVTEILDDTSEDEDDLKPYAKPDSDPEDSDEDATLVNRNKARAPVYVRDLMAGLRDDQNFDRFNISIKTAAQLITRKSGFGKEVTDHAEELAGMLCNLQDPFDIDDFDDMRLQALVAVLLSDFRVIAPLLSKQALAEGYSIAQRCIILSALGLGGRELAGLKREDEDYNPKLSNTDFPSKKLPPRLHAIYDSSSAPRNTHTRRLDQASISLEQQIIQPLALQAADQSTAHLNAVKVRTFSSRMDVDKARTKRKPPANELAKSFGESFFFPLANRYQQEIAAYGGGSIYASVPFVLVTFIKTLALLLHASGPATLGLPQISAEMWDLLLSLRVQAVGDISILQAVLFALLTLLETNTDKQRIAQEHPKQLMETQQWVDLVFERMGSSGLVDDEGKDEEAKVRTLAAGVLMKCREIIEAYQKQLVGYGFM